MKRLCLGVVFFCSLTGNLRTSETHRPEDHAPAGVMGDHVHGLGEVMIGYHFMRMSTKGIQDGSKKLETRDVYSLGYSLAPSSMTETIHLVEAMWGLSRWATLMVTIPFLTKEMKEAHLHEESTNAHDTHAAPLRETIHLHAHQGSGLGDVSLNVLTPLVREERQRLVALMGLRLPTGTIEASSQEGFHNPYPMQFGSGTFDVTPTLTYALRTGRWSGGIQWGGVLRTGRNRFDYRLGHRGSLTGWGAFRPTRWMSLSVRLGAEIWGDVEGADPLIPPTTSPTADPKRQGGQLLEGALGTNLLLKKQRLSGEVTFPLTQNLHGPQMPRSWTATLGWQTTL